MKPTFAVGHLALGYLTGKATSKLLNLDINIPLLLTVSVIPDIDILFARTLIPGLVHRGPTHSLIIFGILLIPALLLYRKKAIPYFIALTQHSLIGDYITGGTQLLWPLTSHMYGTGMKITSPTNIVLEWCFFLTSLTLMLSIKDMWMLFQPHPSNLLLSIPLFTVILPTFLNFPMYVPLELVIPHLAYLALFALSIIVDLKAILF